MSEYTVMMLPGDTTKTEILKKYVDSFDPSLGQVSNDYGLSIYYILLLCVLHQIYVKLVKTTTILFWLKNAGIIIIRNANSLKIIGKIFPKMTKSSGIVKGPLHYSFEYAYKFIHTIIALSQ